MRSNAARRGAQRVAALALAGLLSSPALAAGDDPWREGDASGIVVAPESGTLAYVAEPFRVRARGLLAVDYRRHDSRNVRRSDLRLDRALLGADAEWLDRFDFRVLADLRGTDTRHGLEEAWVSTGTSDRKLRVTAGVVRVPLGIEHSLPEETLPFVEYAFPAFLTGRSDIGGILDGEFAEGWFSYALTGTAGEGSDLLGNRRGDTQLAGRVVTYPFRPVDLSFEVAGAEIPVLSGFFFSAAASHSWDVSSPIEYANSFRNKLVDTSRIQADRAWAWHLGYGFDLGPVRILHEFARGSLIDVRLPDGRSRDFEGQNASWSASIAWRITGEPYDSRPFRQRQHPALVPARPLYRDGEWGPGAIEVAVRYANIEIDRDLIDFGFTTFALGGSGTGLSSQESRTFDVALDWYPVAPVRLTFQLTRTLADQRPIVFDSHGRDTSFLFRLQLSL